MKNYFFATHLTFRPLIRTAPRFKNVLIRLLRRSNVLYFPNSSPRRSPACSRTSLTRIDFLPSFSFSIHSYSPVEIHIPLVDRLQNIWKLEVVFSWQPQIKNVGIWKLEVGDFGSWDLNFHRADELCIKLTLSACPCVLIFGEFFSKIIT